jgi:hypothetical protein
LTIKKAAVAATAALRVIMLFQKINYNSPHSAAAPRPGLSVCRERSRVVIFSVGLKGCLHRSIRLFFLIEPEYT